MIKSARLLLPPTMCTQWSHAVFAKQQAYERAYPVANYARNDCGIVHIIVGSAGNDEGLSTTPNGWIDQVGPMLVSWCAAGD